RRKPSTFTCILAVIWMSASSVLNRLSLLCRSDTRSCASSKWLCLAI
ncbi:MAG: DUF645 family protein, partial [Oscillospiraceae bacterium]|nr:DUF645 family protein [Oscillospiraceae bacterium]